MNGRDEPEQVIDNGENSGVFGEKGVSVGVRQKSGHGQFIRWKPRHGRRAGIRRKSGVNNDVDEQTGGGGGRQAKAGSNRSALRGKQASTKYMRQKASRANIGLVCIV